MGGGGAYLSRECLISDINLSDIMLDQLTPRPLDSLVASSSGQPKTSAQRWCIVKLLDATMIREKDPGEHST